MAAGVEGPDPVVGGQGGRQRLVGAAAEAGGVAHEQRGALASEVVEGEADPVGGGQEHGRSWVVVGLRTSLVAGWGADQADGVLHPLPTTTHSGGPGADGTG